MSHIPVLLNEAIEGLEIKSGEIVVDATVGLGGHSSEICRRYGRTVTIIGLDLDEDALNKTKEKLDICDAVLVNDNFRNLGSVLTRLGREKVDKILADLGISSPELDTSGRGFSFQKDEPLLMNFKKNLSSTDLTAEEILNNWSEETLADIIYGYGEERYARRIARKIVAGRKLRPIKTTLELVAIIKSSVPRAYERGKIHFATRTFQALRIAVNDELRALEEFLAAAYAHLRPGGRMAVITFHSLEDRIVKRFYKSQKTGGAKIVNKKPITPSRDEILKNRRARSAKLRILEK